MDELLIVRSLLDSAREPGLGPLSARPVDLDSRCRLDVAFERALGLGSLSLRAMGLLVWSWLGVDTRLRIFLSRVRSKGLSLAARSCLLLQQSNSARELRWLVSARAGRALAQAGLPARN